MHSPAGADTVHRQYYLLPSNIEKVYSTTVSLIYVFDLMLQGRCRDPVESPGVGEADVKGEQGRQGGWEEGGEGDVRESLPSSPLHTP